MFFENIKIENIPDTKANRKALLKIAQLAVFYDGSFDWSRVTDRLDDLYISCDDESDFIDRLRSGDYDPNADWHRFDDYGSIESVSDDDLTNEAWSERGEIIDWFNKNSYAKGTDVISAVKHLEFTDSETENE